ncbi:MULTISPECIES: flagellar basal body L-ring protein FlgH [unclassified Herbaspirillum]|uniref:flagellar basal body L-ring protein FlgH n=1 Tax=unclassified Herbaspirillum TaxID=2624150 RepID=UPI00115006D5|nr:MULTISPECIES: flagellar basal body L-ring protein FlgH [unclassified Herbaspirillum]MBB5393877.1 flagellar L-ring protein precursor FlgH [Herbaspirillum sp. SJZ102]TQK00085.1 flagellar L-ring protein precursor FlgH [Herbaspirillum sp. SJZ130]TQK04590.1 flagellar L-ring protein precursor FlgH [Herbaspirillum sp. SJZ106]TWC63163.1 flagellar L-ring protein precursor FlgH [Herbaspirillum sp. SJZ099]
MKFQYRLAGACALAASLSACYSPAPMVSGPTSVRPSYPVANVENNGAIFRVSSAQLFEEPTAYNVGDIIKIDISESISGSNKSATNNSTDTTLSQKGPGSSAPLGGLFTALYDANYSASGSNSFKGSGDTSNSNTMTGTLMVSIVEVLPNRNLVVAGEKRIGINSNVNTLRFSGVVRTRDIRGGVVASANVADARLEQVGGGTVADASTDKGFFRRLLTIW